MALSHWIAASVATVAGSMVGGVAFGHWAVQDVSRLNTRMNKYEIKDAENKPDPAASGNLSGSFYDAGNASMDSAPIAPEEPQNETLPTVTEPETAPAPQEPAPPPESLLPPEFSRPQP
ncbi:MAG: hypothetical protein DI551_08670 [Micavibrio aeruginosavorus]|uniref:Uncharacterized protein n=1 Tax=Micavibrio aeruginosavorus TaxID=349221 RepID=A0A2W5MXG5_9BACT|nr:MAG: hypothetical protein DI551_08670 [Micavibrio aeruginosavorus]